MRVAGSTLLYSRLPLEEACHRLVDVGFRAVDVAVAEGWAHVDPSEMVGAVDRAADRIAAACRSASLDPVAFNGGLGRVGIDEQVRRLEALAAVADRLDVGTVTLQPDGPDGELRDDLDRFRTLAVATADYDVTLCVEAHYDTHAEDPSVAVRYAREVPGVELTLDPSHQAVGPHWGDDGYDPLLDHVGHVHLRQAGDDWERVQLSVDDPAGRIGFRRLFEHLRAAGYDGPLSVEYIDSLEGVDPGTAERQAERMADRANELLATIE